MRINRPVIDLLNAPTGSRISQLLFGEDFEVERVEGAQSFGHARCGYQGWLPSAALAENRRSSHYVCALASFVYAAPDMKTEYRLRLPMSARVNVSGTDGEFSRIPEGYIFTQHLASGPMPDYTTTAERFLGTPYLWGGRSSTGVDCSGLVQLVLHIAGMNTARDSGPQSSSIGKPLPLDARLKRGDLVFWGGHVGIMQNATHLLHATAFSMQVMSEALSTTAARVRSQGYGEISAIRRL